MQYLRKKTTSNYLCDSLVTHRPCLTSRFCPAWQLRLIIAVLLSMCLSVMT